MRVGLCAAAAPSAGAKVQEYEHIVGASEMLQPVGLFPAKTIFPLPQQRLEQERHGENPGGIMEAVEYNVPRYGWFCQKIQKFLECRNEETRNAVAQAVQYRRIFQHLACDFTAEGQFGIHLRSEPPAEFSVMAGEVEFKVQTQAAGIPVGGTKE